MFLISENRLLRDGMVRLLQKGGELRMVGSRPAAGLAWQEVAATRCKVVLAECATVRNKLRLLEDLSSNIPEIPLVIFGIYEDLDLFLTLLSLRVSGYALKDASVDKLVGLIKEVANNDFLPCHVAECMDSDSVEAVPGRNF